MTEREKEFAVTSYLETILRSQGEEESKDCDVSDLPLAILAEAEADLDGFAHACLQGIGLDPFEFFPPWQVAYAFALSRNGHGAGFFDSPWQVATQGGDERVRDLANDLQACARSQGTYDLHVEVNEDGTFEVTSHG